MSIKARLIRLESIKQDNQPAKPLVILFGDEPIPAGTDEQGIIRIRVRQTEYDGDVIITKPQRL